MSKIHPQDQQRIEQLHGAASADIEERLISLQDASYELGRQRGMAEGKEQRDELLEALQFAIRFHDQLTPSDVERMRKIVAKATGSTT